MYADDLVIYGTSRFHVQQALTRLNSAIGDLGPPVNLSKTMAMKFRQGGRIATGDALSLAGLPISYVGKFPYLGLILPSNGRSFSAHISERCRKAMVASSMIRKPHLLSLKTALQLFNLKVAPITTYGVELIWENLTPANLESLDRVKAAFLKRTLGLHPSAKNRLVYCLAQTPLFSKELQERLGLSQTSAFN